MNSIDTAHLWAEDQAASEAEAFENAIKRIKPFEVDDVYEQAYRSGYSAGYQAATEKLRPELEALRNAIARSTEEEYD